MTDNDPDVGLAVGGPSADDVSHRAKEITHLIAREFIDDAPVGWERFDVVFAFTAAAEIAEAWFTGNDRLARVSVPESVSVLARTHRDLTAALADGPWWRLELAVLADGQFKARTDYGDEPFPDGQLHRPEAYLHDLRTYPRKRVPVWLAAYVSHRGRQVRTARAAARAAASGTPATLSVGDFPALDVLWARWATIAAMFAAVGSERGPRMLPSLAWFEGSKRSGATLYRLPGGRAVLSGGLWNAPNLEAVYNHGAPMPDFYAGAPAWVTNPVLSPRAAVGALSFCYWWEHGRWYRGDSPPAKEFVAAVPAVWSESAVVEVVATMSRRPAEAAEAGARALVAAAEAGVVTRDTVVNVFGAEADVDVDAAMEHLSIAGVVATVAEPIPESDAIALVRGYVTDRNIDTKGYPLDKLRAQRLDVGWMVYVPTEPGQVSIGRAIFYVADDGIVERSSSSVAPSQYIAGFTERFAERTGISD